ncbi:50S ribosomal protein L6 [Candidatus Microgenomates bacterium]|nr:50S ribosomal protein L6 [Candidatus Microgenomates bacterium]
MVKIKPLIVKIPENTKVTLEKNSAKVEGSKGTLLLGLPSDINVAVQNGEIVISRTGNEKKIKALHGLIRSLFINMFVGVNEGFKKTLELSGVGFRAQVEGDQLVLSVGFSHPVKFAAPEGISFAVSENKITVSGIDKQLVGQIAHTIRSSRPAEPYKGKGIKYEGERIRRKAGKAKAMATGAK